MPYNGFDLYNYLQCATGVIIGKYFWTAAINFNGLYRIDMEHWVIEEIAMFSEEVLGEELYTRKIINIGTKLYIIPGRASSIAVFDIVDFSLFYIQVKGGGLCDGCKFGEAISFKNTIYLFPQWLDTDKIFKINTERNEISYCMFPKQLVDGKEGQGTFLFGNPCGEEAWIALGDRRGVARFDFHTEQLQVHNIKCANSSFIDAVGFKGKIYLLTWKNQIIEFDPQLECETIIWEERNENETYCRIMQIGEDLWLLPLGAESIVKIDLDKRTYERLSLSPELKRYARWNRECTKFSDYSIYNGKVYLWPFGVDKVVILDYQNMTLDYRPLLLSFDKKKQLESLYFKFCIKESLIIDEHDMPLRDYLRGISTYNLEYLKEEDGFVGKQIYSIL